MVDTPTKEPTTIVSGDTVVWRREDLTDYPASSYTLTYEVKGPASFTITASADGDNYTVTLAGTDTDDYNVGTYWYDAYITDGSAARTRIKSGQFHVRKNMAEADRVFDGRTHAEKMIALLEAVSEGKAVHDVSAYSFGGRSVQKLSPEQLLRWMKYYRSRRRAEIVNEKRRAGKTVRNSVKARLQ